jgi:hypothetical protein
VSQNNCLRRSSRPTSKQSGRLYAIKLTTSILKGGRIVLKQFRSELCSSLSCRNAKRAGLELVDNLPVVGLIKAGVHGALGQHRRARAAAIRCVALLFSYGFRCFLQLNSIRGGLSTVLTVPAIAVPFVSGPAIAAAVGSNIARLAAVRSAHSLIVFM